MTLDEMCMMAARYSDRFDEFEKNEDGEYEDDALQYFNVFRDAINEAYFEISRQYAMPDIYTVVQVDDELHIDLANLYPSVYSVKNLMNADKTAAVPFTYYTKYALNVYGREPGDELMLYYQYIPDRLEALNDEPIFPESIVDPNVYVYLAVARIWMSEKKFDYADRWLQQYYMALRSIRSNMSSNVKRIPRRLFR